MVLVDSQSFSRKQETPQPNFDSGTESEYTERADQWTDPKVIKGVFKQLKEDQAELVWEAYTNPESRKALGAVIAADENYQKIFDTEEKIAYALQEMVGFAFLERVEKEHPGVTDLCYDGSWLYGDTNEGPFLPDQASVDEIIKVIHSFADAVDKEFSEKNPNLSAQIGFMRMDAAHKSLSPDRKTTTFDIRFSRPGLVLTRENFNVIADEWVLDLLFALVRSHCNILISGETGAGKTELQKLLISIIQEKLCMVADSDEMHLKENFPEKKGIETYVACPTMSSTDLIYMCLRHNPKWLMLAEARDGAEAWALRKAALTNHNVISTLHAYSARGILDRLVDMCLEVSQANETMLRRQLQSYFQIGIQMAITKLNGRRIRYINEIVEYQPNQLPTTLYARWEEWGQWKTVIGPISNRLKRKMMANHVKFQMPNSTISLNEAIESDYAV
ncbi:ATPase, T2SS/T4P/T4SS family [Sporolactobacillus sp. KGMB 08714]|uniref:ATPase, T2SS/T4P/T4SS family n=1 Tax=Sporolactobacillus sp. KGMB 08714 TaxID=3064704 RepID=UPI002FBD8763